MSRIRVILAAVAVPVTVAALVLSAQGAQASTPGCTGGALSGFCATQVTSGATPLVILSNFQSAAYDNPIIGWYKSAAPSDPATDWFQLAYQDNPSLGVMFFFAPNGVITNMCMSDPGDFNVRLRVCNGSNWQRWIATPVPGSTVFFTWRNRATNKVLQAGSPGAQLVTAPQATATPTSQQWQFLG